jgi:hypothetical protein
MVNQMMCQVISANVTNEFPGKMTENYDKLASFIQTKEMNFGYG